MKLRSDTFPGVTEEIQENFKTLDTDSIIPQGLVQISSKFVILFILIYSHSSLHAVSFANHTPLDLNLRNSCKQYFKTQRIDYID
jgi:hypothetical protein